MWVKVIFIIQEFIDLIIHKSGFIVCRVPWIIWRGGCRMQAGHTVFLWRHSAIGWYTRRHLLFLQNTQTNTELLSVGIAGVWVESYVICRDSMIFLVPLLTGLWYSAHFTSLSDSVGDGSQSEVTLVEISEARPLARIYANEMFRWAFFINHEVRANTASWLLDTPLEAAPVNYHGDICQARYVMGLIEAQRQTHATPLHANNLLPSFTDLQTTDKQANFGNNGTRELKFGSFDDGDDNEHTSVGSAAISQIFLTQGDFSLTQFINNSLDMTTKPKPLF